MQVFQGHKMVLTHMFSSFSRVFSLVYVLLQFSCTPAFCPGFCSTGGERKHADHDCRTCSEAGFRVHRLVEEQLGWLIPWWMDESWTSHKSLVG